MQTGLPWFTLVFEKASYFEEMPMVPTVDWLSISFRLKKQYGFNGEAGDAHSIS